MEGTLQPQDSLVVLLHPGASHAIDDGVPARVHVHDGVDNGDQRECKHNGEPQDDVEDGRIVAGVGILCGLKTNVTNCTSLAIFIAIPRELCNING